MIEYLIFFEKGSNHCFNSLGGSVEFPGMGVNETEGFTKMYFEFLSKSNIPDLEIKSNNYLIKTKPSIYGMASNGSIISVIKGDYDLDAFVVMKPKHKDLYLDAILETKNTIEDNERIDCMNYSDLTQSLCELFLTYKYDFYDISKFSDFKDKVIKHIDEYFECEDSTLKKVIDEDISEKEEIISVGDECSQLIGEILKFYNINNNVYFGSNKSSLIYDFGFAKILTNILSINKIWIQEIKNDDVYDFFEKIKKSIKIKDYTTLADINDNLNYCI